MFRLIAYGTLRPGCALHNNIKPLIETHGGEVFHNITIQGVRMYVLGGAPAAVRSKNLNDELIADIIECDLSPRWFYAWERALERMEGFPYTGYYPDMIGTLRGKAMIYLYDKPIPKDAPRITDWKVWERKFEAMTPEEQMKIMGKSARITLVAAGGQDFG